MERELTSVELIVGGIVVHIVSTYAYRFGGYVGMGLSLAMEIVALSMMIIGLLRIYTHRKSKTPRKFWGIFKKQRGLF